jgi:4-hydroxy-tetrahydrodipicolinate synthase
VLAGTGLSNTDKTIEQTRRAAALGADAALVVTPPYVRPTQAGLDAHFRAVADDGALPVVLYNVPGRTGCDLLPETAAALAGHPRIVGIKEARAEPERMAALLPLRDDGFAVLSGDDPTAMRAMLAGADGLVSVASNVLPRAMRRLCDLSRGARDADAARALDARLQPVFGFLGAEPNPIPLKALLARMQLGHGLRLPLTTLSPALAGDADGAIAAINEIEHACRDLLAA